MRLYGAMFAISAALAVSAAASVSHAQSRSAPRADTPTVSLSQTQTPQRRGLQWSDDRWGLNLNLQQPVGREAEWSDVEAGAFYRLTPRLRVGGAVGLGEPVQDPARAAETDRRSQPRVRLETIFKF